MPSEMVRSDWLRGIFPWKLIFLVELPLRNLISTPTPPSTSRRRKLLEDLELTTETETPSQEEKAIEKTEEKEEKEAKEGKVEKEEKRETMENEDLEEKKVKEDQEEKKMAKRGDQEEKTAIVSLESTEKTEEKEEKAMVTDPRLSGLKLVQLSPEKKILTYL